MHTVKVISYLNSRRYEALNKYQSFDCARSFKIMRERKLYEDVDTK